MAAGIYPPRERPIEATTNVMEETEMEGGSILYLLTEREWMEVEYCRVYAEEYNHGTDGHSIRLLVAKLADLLEECYPDEDAE